MFSMPIPGFGYTTNSSADEIVSVTSSGYVSPKRQDATQTARDLVDELPQPLFALTVTLPFEVPNFTVTDAVPCPAVITAPLGTVQVYVNPAITGVENTTPCWFLHTVEGPAMDAGVDGNLLNVMLRAVPEPQAFTALTVIEPLLKLLLKFTFMLVPLLLTMLAPVGTVQV